MMERQLAQMVRLIDDLLDVSRISRGKIELRRARVDLATSLQQRGRNEPAADRGSAGISSSRAACRASPIDVRWRRRPGWRRCSPTCSTTPPSTPSPAGAIRLSVERRESEAVVVDARHRHRHSRARCLPRMFDMFTQVDRSLEKSQGGLGIGLSLVKRLVEMHGGSVEARSEGARPGKRVRRAAAGRDRRLVDENNGEDRCVAELPRSRAAFWSSTTIAMRRSAGDDAEDHGQ